MTYVGKILVLVIMAFSLIFLGISTVVFTTSKNWQTATQAEKKKADELKKKVNETQAVVDSSKQELTAAQQAAAAQAKQLEQRINELEDTNKRDLAQITDIRAQLVTANQNAKSALDEVEAKRQETGLLRTQKKSVEQQANEFKLRQAELNDQIRELQRMLDTATKNNSNLREQVAKFSTLLRQNGLPTDISQIKGLETPPPVTGVVKRVDPTGRRIEMTIGTDDGIVQGHELFIFRTQPRTEYIAKVTIVSADPDQAVARVIGKTYQGKHIKEGDVVSSTVKPNL